MPQRAALSSHTLHARSHKHVFGLTEGHNHYSALLQEIHRFSVKLLSVIDIFKISTDPPGDSFAHYWALKPPIKTMKPK